MRDAIERLLGTGSSIFNHAIFHLLDSQPMFSHGQSRHMTTYLGGDAGSVDPSLIVEVGAFSLHMLPRSLVRIS